MASLDLSGEAKPAPDRNKGQRRASNPVFAVILAILICCAVCLIWWFVSISERANPGQSDIDAISLDSLDSLDDAMFPFPEIDWQHWESVNPAIVGWICIPGTNIDHPIVQATPEDPEFYLDHDIYGKENPLGSIFLDADCAEEGLYGRNSVVLGHHVESGSMMSDASKYSDHEFAKDHAAVILMTPDDNRIFGVRFASVVEGVSATKQTSFASETEYEEWLEGRFNESCMRLVDSPLPYESMLTLCTCSYSTWPSNERTLVYASEL